MSGWYYQIMGEEIGPLDANRMRQLAHEGTIAPDTPVRKGDNGRWVMATSVKGLFSEHSKTESESHDPNAHWATTGSTKDDHHDLKQPATRDQTNGQLIDDGRQIQFNCPHCGRLARLAVDYVGTARKCLQCGETVVIPTPSVTAATNSKVRHGVPVILIIYGWGMMVFFGAAIATNLIGIVVSFFILGPGGFCVAFVGILSVTIDALFFEAGYALTKGSRQGVIGLMSLAGLLLLIGGGGCVVDWRAGILVIVAVLVLFTPPIVVGLRCWNRLVGKVSRLLLEA